MLGCVYQQLRRFENASTEYRMQMVGLVKKSLKNELPLLGASIAKSPWLLGQSCSIELN